MECVTDEKGVASGGCARSSVPLHGQPVTAPDPRIASPTKSCAPLISDSHPCHPQQGSGWGAGLFLFRCAAEVRRDAPSCRRLLSPPPEVAPLLYNYSLWRQQCMSSGLSAGTRNAALNVIMPFRLKVNLTWGPVRCFKPQVQTLAVPTVRAARGGRAPIQTNQARTQAFPKAPGCHSRFGLSPEGPGTLRRP